MGRNTKILGIESKGLGYHIRAERLSPHQFGIPQIRERVYIVGSLLPLDNFVWPDTSRDETNIDSVLDKTQRMPSNFQCKCKSVLRFGMSFKGLSKAR